MATIDKRRKGRGATGNPAVRYDAMRRESVDDGWSRDDEEIPSLRTRVEIDTSRSVISRNQSPDVPFDQSLNSYRGCEHGCIYCYARPSHAYLGLSPGLDFESRLFVKPNTAALLRSELAKPSYRCRPLALGTNTDPYQPVERDWKLTRAVLELMDETGHPVSIVTKSSLVERDLDLLSGLAARRLVQVMISITTLDRVLARRMEPRAASPQRRLQTVRTLVEAGIPVGILTAPVIPALNDEDLEAILEAGAGAGASTAGWILLRLPQELGGLFEDWLRVHYPLKADHVLRLLREARNGKVNDPRFGARMRGQGPVADLVEQRFRRACRRLGLNTTEFALDTGSFLPPVPVRAQMDLF
jgi:DNA repair photolyase